MYIYMHMNDSVQHSEWKQFNALRNELQYLFGLICICGINILFSPMVHVHRVVLSGCYTTEHCT